MSARPDRSGFVHPTVTGPRLPGRLRMRRELVLPPKPAATRG
ncbi:hypothetical protein SAMN05660485_00756 [Blastococcus fimeti]|nr:hypothetical protein SAMN05660485_00756 [Blastococcus fimeti]